MSSTVRSSPPALLASSPSEIRRIESPRFRVLPCRKPHVELRAAGAVDRVAFSNDGRMIVDDFKAYAPTGEAVSSYVTLRTYSEASHRWEMAGLSALQPAASAEWYGELKDGEMLLYASGKDPAGNLVKTKIRFFDIAKNSFNWESKVSRDEGKTWVKTASLLASRASQ